jgi:hypothetical protein
MHDILVFWICSSCYQLRIPPTCCPFPKYISSHRQIRVNSYVPKAGQFEKITGMGIFANYQETGITVNKLLDLGNFDEF